MTQEISFEIRNSVLIITFDRAGQGNALTPFMVRTLSDKLKAISEDRGIRAILLRGANDCFMDGQDMHMLAGDTNSIQEYQFQKTQFFYAAIRELSNMERPVVAALDGRVSGAGFSFMLASDFTVASDRTTFNAGFTSFAMVPDGGVSFLLPRKVGVSQAAEILMLGEDIPVQRGKELNLVNRIVPAAKLHEEALALAEKLASGPTRILGATKRLITSAYEHDMNTHLSIEASTWVAGSKTFDFREAMRAYTEKRAPRYTGS